MDEFLIQSADRGAQLLFFDRIPTDSNQLIEGFGVRITDLNLSAATIVDASCLKEHPATLFADMARQWQGWSGELEWRSLENELSLRCTRDRLGHIRIGIQLRSWTFGWNSDWEVRAAVMVEAGQLERLAKAAAAFFGQPR